MAAKQLALTGFLCAAIAGLPSLALGQERAIPKVDEGTLGGRVLDADTSEPLANVEVFLFSMQRTENMREPHAGAQARTSSDERGRFSFPVTVVDQPVCGLPGVLTVAKGTEVVNYVVLTRLDGYKSRLETLPASPLEADRDIELKKGPSRSVRVRVVDPKGKPAVGVGLRLMMRISLPPLNTLLFTNLTTGQGGRARVGGLPPAANGKAEVGVAYGQGYGTKRYDAKIGAEPPELVIKLDVAGRLLVGVTMTTPPPRLLVTTPSGGMANWDINTWPVDNGRKVMENLAPGNYLIQLYYPTPGQKTPVDATRSLSEHRVRVVLRAGEEKIVDLPPRPDEELGALVCVIRDAQGKLLPGAAVCISPDGSGWRGFAKGTTGPDGKVRFARLPRGRYQAQVNAEFPDEAQAKVQVDKEEVTLELVGTPRLPLSGFVVDTTGDPVPNASMMLTPAAGGMGTTVPVDAKGRFSVPYTTGRVRAHVEAPEFESKYETLNHDGTPVTIVMRAGRTLLVRGEVDDRESQLPLRARLRVVSPDGMGESSSGSSSWVRDGVFEIRFPGIARTSSGSVTIRIGQHVPVTRKLGTADTLDFGALKLDRGRTVSGRLSGPEEFTGGRAHSMVQVGDHFDIYDVKIAPNGRFKISGLSSEPTRLSFSVFSLDRDDDTYFLAEVTVAGTKDEDLGTIELKARDLKTERDGINAFLITITAPDGVLGKAGFKTGDVVVAIAGSRFQGLDQMVKVYEEALGTPEAPKKGDVKFTLKRNSELVDVSVSAEEVVRGTPATLGGRFEPHTVPGD